VPLQVPEGRADTAIGKSQILNESETELVKRVFAPLRLLIGFLSVAIAASLAAPAVAYGAGTGYTPTPGPTPGGGASGLAGTVVSSATIQPSGGTANATIGNSTITVTVKAGAFTGPVQVVITDATSSTVMPTGGGTPVVTFGIGIFENGTKVSGTLPAITVTVNSPSIKAGTTVYFVTNGALQAISGAAVTNGSVTFTITSDPIVEVVAPPATTAAAGSAGSGGTAGTAIAGATSGQTGKPFILEGALAVGLILIGGVMLVGLRLRRRPAWRRSA
jgi:hypothetical protein